jgi:hypothetical protein
MKYNAPNRKSNWQYFWQNFVNRVLLPALWTILPLAIFALIIFFLTL